MARCYTFTTWNVLINFGQRTKLSLFSETFALLSAEGMNDEYSYLFIDVGCLCFGHFLGCQLLSNVFRFVVEEFEFNLRAPSNAVHLSTKPNCSHILLMVLPRGYHFRTWIRYRRIWYDKVMGEQTFIILMRAPMLSFGTNNMFLSNIFLYTFGCLEIWNEYSMWGLTSCF